MSHYHTYNWGSIFLFISFVSRVLCPPLSRSWRFQGWMNQMWRRLNACQMLSLIRSPPPQKAEVILGKPPKFNVPWKDSAWLKLLFILQRSLFFSNFLSSLCFPTQSFFTVNRTPGSDTLRSLIPQFTTFIFFIIIHDTCRIPTP